MHNGRMGRKVSQQTIERAQQLFKKGLTPVIVAKRLGISESMARNIQREIPKPEVTESTGWSQLPESGG
ncbi:hypothetical protein SH449x_002465 [Pirellulaceae bacterium SH449]